MHLDVFSRLLGLIFRTLFFIDSLIFGPLILLDPSETFPDAYYIAPHQSDQRYHSRDDEKLSLDPVVYCDWCGV